MIDIFNAVYLLGMLFWCTVATFNNQFYENYADFYYIWNRIVLVLIVGAARFNKDPEKVKNLNAVFGLVCGQLVWEIVSLQTGLSVNNNIYVGVVFITVVVLCLFITLKDILWPKRKS